MLYSRVIATILIVGGTLQAMFPEKFLALFPPARQLTGIIGRKTYRVWGCIGLIAGCAVWVVSFVEPDVLP